MDANGTAPELTGKYLSLTSYRRDGSGVATPVTASGRLRGSPMAAHAEIVTREEAAAIDRLMAGKYRIDKIFYLPLYNAYQAIFNRRGRPRGTSVVLKITLGSLP